MPRTLHATIVLILFAAPILAQLPPDPAREVEATTRLKLKEAQRLADTDPAKAVDRLQSLLTTLEGDRALPAERRETLTRVVKDRIRVLKAAPEITPPPKALPVPAESDEFAKVKAGLKEAVDLRKQGKTAEANARAADLVKRYPDSVAGQVLQDMGKVTAKREETRAIRKDREESMANALNDVDRAAVVPKDDMTFAKDHKEKMARRRADTAPTGAELKLLKSLETVVNAQFKDSKLEDVTDYLSTMMGLPVLLDKASLDDAGVTYTSPVTFVVKQPVQARTALRGALRTLGLTYVVRDGTVFVTTPTRAREFMVTKAYYLGDLVVPIGNPFLPVGDPLQEAFNVNSLIEMIVTTIDPESWSLRGGPGTIRYYAPTRSIVVRQSAEVHVAVKMSLYK
jgi:hypothetical protein